MVWCSLCQRINRRQRLHSGVRTWDCGWTWGKPGAFLVDAAFIPARKLAIFKKTRPARFAGFFLSSLFP